MDNGVGCGVEGDEAPRRIEWGAEHTVHVFIFTGI